jgi:AraC-like DNA-binding protein
MTGMETGWVARVDRVVEQLIDELAAVDVRCSSTLIRRFVDGMDPPPDRLHGAVLSTVLMDACARIVQRLHEQNPFMPCHCQATIWSHVGRLAAWRDQDPRAAFRDWLDVFYAGLEVSHPIDGALRAAQQIRRDPARAWTVETLAAAAAAKATTLRIQFHERYGVRPLQYVHLARVTAAVAMLRTDAKVESVAWDIGYRSKKDLYAALRRWAGLTPTELRALSDTESAWLERELRIRCLGSGRQARAFTSERPLSLLSGSRRA